MQNNTIFTTKRYLTGEIIEIPLKDINSIEERATIPNGEPNHVRVFLNGIGHKTHPLNDKEGLLLIGLENFYDLVEACKKYNNNK